MFDAMALHGMTDEQWKEVGTIFQRIQQRISLERDTRCQNTV
jgi:hypothetical protein